MCKRMNLGPYLISYININKKWVKDLNLRSKTVKILKENIGDKLLDTGFGYDLTPKAKAMKVIVN